MRAPNRRNALYDDSLVDRIKAGNGRGPVRLAPEIAEPLQSPRSWISQEQR